MKNNNNKSSNEAKEEMDNNRRKYFFQNKITYKCYPRVNNPIAQEIINNINVKDYQKFINDIHDLINYDCVDEALAIGNVELFQFQDPLLIRLFEYSVYKKKCDKDGVDFLSELIDYSVFKDFVAELLAVLKDLIIKENGERLCFLIKTADLIFLNFSPIDCCVYLYILLTYLYFIGKKVSYKETLKVICCSKFHNISELDAIKLYVDEIVARYPDKSHMKFRDDVMRSFDELLIGFNCNYNV